MYATYVQSGERAPTGMPRTKCSAPPAEDTKPTVGVRWIPVARSVVKTICVPCGDHCGQQSPAGGM